MSNRKERECQGEIGQKEGGHRNVLFFFFFGCGKSNEPSNSPSRNKFFLNKKTEFEYLQWG